MLRVVLGVLFLFSFGSCSKGERLAEITVADGKIFPSGTISCLQFRDPPETGLTDDVPGPYHAEFPSMTIKWNSIHALEIQSIVLSFQMPETSSTQTCAFGKFDIYSLFLPGTGDDRNKDHYINGMITPDLSQPKPYTIQTVSFCSLACGNVEIKDPRVGFSASGEALVQGTIHHRDESGKITGEQDAFIETVPLDLRYL